MSENEDTTYQNILIIGNEGHAAAMRLVSLFSKDIQGEALQVTGERAMPDLKLEIYDDIDSFRPRNRKERLAQAARNRRKK
jgi:hypothetical protein